MHTRIVAAVVIVALIPVAARGEGLPAPFQPIKRQGNVIETLKHRIIVSETGFPEQIYIKPDPRDLPLELRETALALDNPALVEFGRGARLRQPIRLVANVGGNNVEASVAAPAQIAKETPGQISYRAELKLGTVSATATTSYGSEGAITFDIQWKTAGPVASLEVVIDFQGAVTHAYRGLPSDFKPDAVQRDTLDVLLPTATDMVVWSNLSPWPAARDATVRYLYVGSLDSGFTWLADDWSVASAAEPMMLVRRDKAGNASLHILLHNAPAEAAEGHHTFALLTHPAKPRPRGFRKTQWLNWGKPHSLEPMADGVENATLKRWQSLKKQAGPAEQIAGGFTGAALEAFAGRIELTGFAGAYAASAEKDNVRLYPNSLFAVLAAPYTGVPVRVQSNMRKLASSGEAPSYDRQYLGRALLHDIGAAITGFKQPYQYVRLINALEEFGFFDTDKIEVLPYWRNAHIIRYGELWSADDTFEVDERNPAEGVYVTAYRKPIVQDGKNGCAALIVVMNENDRPVRERLYILDREKVFGGKNRLTAADLIRKYPFDVLPERSSWQGAKGSYSHWHGSRASKEETFKWLKGPSPVLRDMEDDSFVEHFPTRDAPPPEVYGPLYINARDYRLLYGQWLEE